MPDTLAPIRPDILEDEQVRDDARHSDDEDHDRFKHYVIGGSEAVMQSLLNGTPVRALCGKVWVPSKDPKRYPMCPECEEIQSHRDPGTID